MSSTRRSQRVFLAVMRLTDHGLGILGGVSLLLGSLFLYQSYENRVVLGRWSYAFGGFVALTALLWVAAAGRAVLSLRRSRNPDNARRFARMLIETGVLSWGGAYFISALQDSNNAGRLLDLNVAGSVQPAAVALEWLAIVLVTAGALVHLGSWQDGRLRRLAISAAAVLTLPMVFEGVSRGKAILKPEPMGYPTYSGTMWTNRYVALNADGFRDGEHSLTPDRSRGRLVIIGDAFAFGTGIDRPVDRFGELLATHLKATTGDEWEVLNAGQPDTHTLQHIDQLERALRYRPDLVVLLYAFNDIDYLKPSIPRGGLSEAPSSAIDRLNPLRLLYNNSFLFQEGLVRSRERGRPVSTVAATDPYEDESAVLEHLQDLKKLVDMAESAGASTYVVPLDMSSPTDERARVRYDRFASRAEAAGIRVVHAGDAFAGADVRTLQLNEFDRHPNEYANRLLADFVAPRMAGQSGESAGTDPDQLTARPLGLVGQ